MVCFNGLLVVVSLQWKRSGRRETWEERKKVDRKKVEVMYTM